MKYMIIPTHTSLHYVLVISKHECNVKRKLMYDSYYQHGAEFRLMKSTQLEAYITLTKIIYVYTYFSESEYHLLYTARKKML